MVYEGVVDGVSILMMRWKRGKQDKRRASQHWIGGGVVLGGHFTLIIQWKCNVQIYKTKLLLKGCGSGVPLLPDGAWSNGCWKCGWTVHHYECIVRYVDRGNIKTNGIGDAIHNTAKVVEVYWAGFHFIATGEV
ncbi:hypothetical protein T03_219 [Trichinella britovi]|uniref:Uncharacterized protein n=1 Tax=Trichinella britovi TaxID=45882 RepID=A0A0V1CY39_TRIBR|nr:hypothetical protein T03_219 [Trichinella britovi]